ncbi:MAG: TonB family protein [Candidatus Eisenbacteria bacterium]|nr:TonB family protein [Candidatus Eisenbacteria bacterium]
MALGSPYVTRYRRRRERVYAVRIRWAVAGAVAFHVILALAMAPFRQQIPLVRRMGYEGPVRLMPEIRVRREVGALEAERQVHGRGSEGYFRVVETRLVATEDGEREEPRTDSNNYEEEYGDELLSALERSLPQPTSRDVVYSRFVKPVYPPESIAAGTEGVVEFRVHVTEFGRVARVWVLSSEVDDRMEEAAERALMQWKFRPHVIDGEPTDFLVDVPVRFRLRATLVSDPSSVGVR